ncbi:MAG: ribose 1,5-bisphosphate isomerase [Candidatus Thermoplasmatota archaeon]|nr:ribose 1,5-bisphosphate isomerase [Candidatus Thermoplasmatota archaeon]
MKDPAQEVEEVARSIKSMSIRGAAMIAREASRAIGGFSSSWPGSDRQKFMDALRKVALDLHSTRPTAVSLRNGILLTLRGVETEKDVASMKERIAAQSREFRENAEIAREGIAEIGSKRVPKGSTVLTHCNSMAALNTIERAYHDGRVEMVFSTESRPWRQGHITARWLLDKGIPVTMIVDPAVRHFMRDIDVVVVGADTVTANGAVINKIGTSQIALAAHESRVPFMVCAETFKFSKETLLGSLVEIEDRGPTEVASPMRPSDFQGARILNPVFDATPPEYIDAIVTELGIVSPYMATEVIREMFEMDGPVTLEGKRTQFSWL